MGKNKYVEESVQGVRILGKDYLTYIKANIIRYGINTKWKFALRNCTRLTTQSAQNILDEYYKKERPEFATENIYVPQYDLQVVVPVYNVEQYLAECLSSILNQRTNYSFEIVCVNDGANDNSANILRMFSTDSRIRIIEQKNKGLSGARNTAIKTITGKYVMFVDSDDKLHPDAIQTLLDVALQNDADIVEGGHQEFDAENRYSLNTHRKGIHQCDASALYGFAWGKVIRGKALEKFCFPKGFLFEDTVMSCLLHPECKKIYTISEIVYYYRKNNRGITGTSVQKQESIDTYYMMKYCLEERVKRGQQLTLELFEQYLISVYRNWGRTHRQPLNVQESIFVLSCDLLEKYFGQYYLNYEGRFHKILKTIEKRSFMAFVVLVENAEQFQ